MLLLAAVALAASSTSGGFTVSPDTQMVNWTNTTIFGSYAANITLNTIANVNLTVVNSTSSIINSLGSIANFIVLPSNGVNVTSGTYSEVTIDFNTTGLLPGRYNGTVTVLNSTNSKENASVVVTLDMPLNVNSLGLGNVNGSLAAGTNIFYVNMSAVNAYGIRVNLTGNTTSNVNVTIYDSSDTVKSFTNFSADRSTGFDSTSIQTGMWHLTWAGNAIFNASVELREGSLLANNATSSTIYNRTNKGYNNTVQLNFQLNNNADYDVSITSIANSTSLNNGAYWMNITNIGLSPMIPYVLRANSGMNVTVSVSSNTSTTSNQIGNYNGQLNFSSTGGYPNSTLSVNLVVNLTNTLDIGTVTAFNVTGGPILSGTNVSVSVAPRFWDGTLVPNLLQGNFILTATHQNSSLLTPIALRSGTALNITDVTNIGTAYNFTALVNSTLLGGVYNLGLQVTDNSNINSAAGGGTLTVYDTAAKVAWRTSTAATSAEQRLRLP